MFLFYLFLLYLFIIILLFLLLLFSYKSFLSKYEDLQKRNYNFVLLKNKVYNEYSYFYFNFFEKKFYLNSNFFILYPNVYNYYLKLFGFENLLKLLLEEKEFKYLDFFDLTKFSCLFYDLRNFIRENFTNKDYWLNLFYSFLLFILIFIILYFFFLNYLTPELYINSLILRYCLLLIIILHFFFNYFTITSKIIKDEEEEDYTSKHLFIKLLVLLLKLINSLPTIFNNFFNIFINLILFYLLFNYLNLLSFAYFTLAIYAIILLIIKILYEISNYLINKNYNNKIIVFLYKFKLNTILTLPIGTVILLIWYKILWWVYFFYIAWEEKKLKFYFEVLYWNIFYNKIAADKVFGFYNNDREVRNFLINCYYFNSSSLGLIEYIGKEEFNKSLNYLKEREKNKPIILKYIDLDLALKQVKERNNKIVW